MRSLLLSPPLSSSLVRMRLSPSGAKDTHLRARDPPSPGSQHVRGRLLRREAGLSALCRSPSRRTGALAHALFFLKNP